MTPETDLPDSAQERLRHLPLPERERRSGRQSGIADPRWPEEVPPELLDDPEAAKAYDFFKGRVDPQKFLSIVRADVLMSDRAELAALLADLTAFMREQMDRGPDRGGSIPPQVRAKIPESWRVTITLAFGASLFVTAHGDDRFDLRHALPRWLRTMPRFAGDAPAFEPQARSTDLLFQICSDHPYVNTAVARRLIGERFSKRLRVRFVDQGFARADTREWLGFDDGVSNLRSWPDDTLASRAFVHPTDPEPPWCIDGSYLVYRKIRENMTAWNRLAVPVQEERIGRHKDVNRPLARTTDPRDPTLPAYPSPTDEADGKLDSHVRKSQPRRPAPDFTGTPDLDRRFLRRPYPFFDGVDASGDLVVGLHFLGYMRSLRDQFEWIVQQWQTNPDFPRRGAGMDVMYREGILSAIDGGYYFCPPAEGGTHYIGERMLAWGHTA